MRLFFQRDGHPAADLKVGRLRLVPITPAMLAAEEAHDPEFCVLGRLLAARVTQEWPPVHWEPHVFRFILRQFEERPDTVGWHRYVLLCDARGNGKTLIGCVGGFPRPEGDVEIGYSTLPEFQRRGYATAFASALVTWLLKQKGVVSVNAQTYARVPESVKVMERCGMVFAGAGDEPETVRYRRLR
ncbi:GNAT family N-acetyltransferase [Granulicella sp. S156]|uniref:GNAT family N-acetyltransferase n=1 Tax=Granulicella sp. S156 TaxID=1747224 RepID=UPI001C204559|nr:GNAT family N-acetyltransferase [Granulicella sp. S156]